VQIPHGQVSEVFALMEARSAEYKINDWSISQVEFCEVLVGCNFWCRLAWRMCFSILCGRVTRRRLREKVFILPTK
jgi:hypothetical protein